jgi:hypothetical protein
MMIKGKMNMIRILAVVLATSALAACTSIPSIAGPPAPGESVPPGAGGPPTHVEDACKDGGWVDLGYTNQGLCIADANN